MLLEVGSRREAKSGSPQASRLTFSRHILNEVLLARSIRSQVIICRVRTQIPVCRCTHEKVFDCSHEDSSRENRCVQRNRITGRNGVKTARLFFEDHGCTFQEVGQQHDFGKDAYLDLADHAGVTPLCVALQIKAGSLNHGWTGKLCQQQNALAR